MGEEKEVRVSRKGDEEEKKPVKKERGKREGEG